MSEPSTGTGEDPDEVEGDDADADGGPEGAASGELASLRRSHEALETLYRTSADPSLDVEEPLQRKLRIGPERLGVPNGYLARIDAEPGREVIADRRGAHPDATIEYDGTAASLTVPAAEHLRPVIDELVESAVEHGGPAPRVGVTVRAGPEGVELTVEDDGPGIPEDEREVVAGEVEVTQLSHATGLGLWTVTMVLDAMGGTVRFDSTGTGSRVTVDLPTAASATAG